MTGDHPAQSTAHRPACAALVARARAEGIEQVRIAWADLYGNLRSKTLVLDRDGTVLDDALRDGIAMVGTVLMKDLSDRTAFRIFDTDAVQPPPGLRHGANVLLLPDASSWQRLPWISATGWLRAESFGTDGRPLAADPRRVLQAALAALAGAGFTLRCGLEIEFHIYRIIDERLAAMDAGWPAEPPAVQLLHPGYQLQSEAHADACDEALTIVRRTLLALGLPLRSLEIEFGPSQFEAVFAPTDALTAADQFVLLRSALRQALRRAGYHASFTCRPPLPHAVASGWHLHQSLLHADGRDAMSPDRAGPDARRDEADERDARRWLSPAGCGWLAGLLAHAPALAAMCAPTVPGCSRFQGSVMAPQRAVWGRDHRGAMLRVIGSAQADGAWRAGGVRIENRIGEPLANPYLAIAVQVLAGLDGLRRGLTAPPACVDPYREPGKADDGAGPALPGSLTQSLAALESDRMLCEGLGPDLVTIWLAAQRQHLARRAASDDGEAFDRREYFRF